MSEVQSKPSSENGMMPRDIGMVVLPQTAIG